MQGWLRGLLLSCFLLPGLVLAQEAIEDFAVTLQVEADGDLLVTEHITVRAEGRDIRRGIYRDLPVSYALPMGLEQSSPITLLGAWSRLTDSNDSYRWDVGGAYSWGNLRLSLAYERTKDKGWYNGGKSNSGIADSTLINGVAATMNSWIVGLNYKLGPGTLKASFNYVKLKDVNGVDAANGGNYWSDNSSADLKQYGLGYIYDLSKRTSIYGILAYTDFENQAISNFFRGAGYNNDSVTGVQLGITHKF